MSVDVSVPFRPHKDGVEIFVKSTPNASRDLIQGLTTDTNDRQYFKVYVTAIPENNKANDAIIVLLSKKFNIPKSCITQTSGHTQRFKIFLLDGVGAQEVEDVMQENT